MMLVPFNLNKCVVLSRTSSASIPVPYYRDTIYYLEVNYYQLNNCDSHPSN